MIAASCVKISILPQKSWPSTLALALAITVISQISDLAESALKRNYAVKDSGSLLPGHGGVLDRFDSFLFTSPIVYYLLKLIM